MTGTGTPCPVGLVSNISVLPSMYLTSPSQGQEENCLEGQMLQGGLFNWFKMTLVSWCKNQGEVPGGDSLPVFGSVSVETIQETSEIFILTDLDGRISQSISNG